MKVISVVASLASAHAAFASTAAINAVNQIRTDSAAYPAYVEGFIKQFSLQLEADVKGSRACVDTGMLIEEHLKSVIEEMKSKDIVKIVHSLQTLVDVWVTDLPATFDTCTSIDMPEENRQTLRRINEAILHDRPAAAKMIGANIKENALALVSAITSLLAAQKSKKHYEAGKAAADLLVNILVGPGTKPRDMFMDEELQNVIGSFGYPEGSEDFKDALVSRLISNWSIDPSTGSSACHHEVKELLDYTALLNDTHGDILGYLYMLFNIENSAVVTWKACDSVEMDPQSKEKLGLLINSKTFKFFSTIALNAFVTRSDILSIHAHHRSARKAGDFVEQGIAYADMISSLTTRQNGLHDDSDALELRF